MTDSAPTTHLLRRRWKPAKERLHAEQQDHPTAIRIHRVFSWLQRVEQLEDGADLDIALLCRWIAFNALYGKWDEKAGEPMADRDCLRMLLDRLLNLDAEARIPSVLNEHKKLVMSILDDEYLSRFFWEDPSPKRAGQSKKAKFDARTWYIEERWVMVLSRLLERIYFLRCQLVHGAATHGGKLNRTSLRRCNRMLECLLPSFMLVVIDHGADEDWGRMCYPPQG